MVSSKFSVPTDDDGIEPIALSIEQTARATGESRSSVYNRLGLGQYKAIKSGARTLVLYASVKAHIASLPKAVIKPPKKRKRRERTPQLPTEQIQTSLEISRRGDTPQLPGPSKSKPVWK